MKQIRNKNETKGNKRKQNGTKGNKNETKMKQK
jgi:hypothetical protein